MTVSCSSTGIYHTSGALTQQDVSRRFDVIADTSYAVFDTYYLKNGYFSAHGRHLKPSQKPEKIMGHRTTMKDALHWICRVEKEKASFVT